MLLASEDFLKSTIIIQCYEGDIGLNYSTNHQDLLSKIAKLRRGAIQ